MYNMKVFNGQTLKHYKNKQMKAFAVALLGLAVTAPAMAGPYVSTKSEFKGDEGGYSKTVHQARVGYATKLDNGIKPLC